MADDHNALLARLDHPGRETHHGLSVLCKAAAAELRALTSRHHTALEVIRRFDDFIQAYMPHFIHEGFVDGDDLAALDPTDEDIWTPEERTVLDQAKDPHP